MSNDENIVIWLPWPPTVNDYWKPVRGSLYLSRKGRLYKEKVARELAEQIPDVELETKLLVEVTLFPPDNRTRDLDNYMKGLLDSITATKIWVDDSQIDQLFIYRGETIKNGAAKIEVSDAGPVVPFPLSNN